MKLTESHSRQLYQRLLGYVAPYKSWFVWGILATILLAFSNAAIPLLMQPLLDGTFVDRDPAFLQWAPLGVVLLFAARGLTTFVSQTAFAALAARMVADIREDMFSKLLRLPASYHDQHPSGSLISKLNYDVTQVTQAGTEVLVVLIRDSLTIVGLLAVVIYLDWQLSLLVFLLAPVIALVANLAGKRMRKLSKAIQNSFGEMTHQLNETTHGYKVVKIFTAEDHENHRFGIINKAIRQLQLKFAVAANIGIPIVETMGALIIALVIILGTQGGAEEAMSVGTFVAFFGALAMMFSPIKKLIKINDPLQRGLAAAESIFALLDAPQEIDQGHHKVERAEGRIQIKQLNFTYTETDNPALHDLSLEIPAKSTIALVGASGSGKSTLANLIPRFYLPEAEQLLVDSMDIRDWSLSNLRQQIAYVGQDVHLFNDTVANNIRYGQNASLEQIQQAAQSAAALEFIQALPNGFDTLIGENGSRLSGGQRQRLAIARAILHDAPILILDEATSALDTQSERLIQQALEQLRQNRTTIIIAHRLSTIEHVDCIYVFDKGQLIEQGSHQTLVDKSGYYAALLNQQIATETNT